MVVLRVAYPDDIMGISRSRSGREPRGFGHTGGQYHDYPLVEGDLQLEPQVRITPSTAVSCGSQVATITRPLESGATPRD